MRTTGGGSYSQMSPDFVFAHQMDARESGEGMVRGTLVPQPLNKEIFGVAQLWYGLAFHLTGKLSCTF